MRPGANSLFAPLGGRFFEVGAYSRRGKLNMLGNFFEFCDKIEVFSIIQGV